MSDIAYWPFEAFAETFEYIKKYYKHNNNYLFLTKNPELLDINSYDEKIWFGVSITKISEVHKIYDLLNNTDILTKRFLNIEPILEDFNVQLGEGDISTVNWVIIGAETGNQKSKVIPKKEWINHIANTCRNANVPLFMKSSLKDIMGNDFIQEWPKELNKVLIGGVKDEN
jgi:protein gp37